MRLAGAVIASAAFAGAASAQPGRLVIAGGAVAPDNAAVHGAFLAGVGVTDRVAVIPAASEEPAQSARRSAETLARHGVSADRIDVVRLAVVDDVATPDVDESAWATNAGAAAEIAKINNARAIWFTGGDQVRIANALLEPDGRATPMLSAIRARLASGATLGGTSAGAAIMSAAMIARGDSLAALSQPVLTGDESESTMDGGALLVARGLGFLPVGVVDQHFDRKARLGRLTRAVMQLAPDRRIGFGVDEDTALIVDLATGNARVAGARSVTVIDARQARSWVRRGRFSAAGVRLSSLAAGDALALADMSVTPDPGRRRIAPGGGHYTHEAQSGAGMAVPNERLEDALGVELLDNARSARLERISFDARGAGVRYVFAETPESWGAFGGGRYTIASVAFGIDPVQVRVAGIR